MSRHKPGAGRNRTRVGTSQTRQKASRLNRSATVTMQIMYQAFYSSPHLNAANMWAAAWSMMEVERRGLCSLGARHLGRQEGGPTALSSRRVRRRPCSPRRPGPMRWPPGPPAARIACIREPGRDRGGGGSRASKLQPPRPPASIPPAALPHTHPTTPPPTCVCIGNMASRGGGAAPFTRIAGCGREGGGARPAGGEDRRPSPAKEKVSVLKQF